MPGCDQTVVLDHHQARVVVEGDEHGLQAGDSIGNRDRLEHTVHGEVQACRAFVLLSHGGVKGSDSSA